MGQIKLVRYTNLASTIHILRSKSLTLLDPENWDDRNDASYIAEYKRRKGFLTALALCFAEGAETYHHWRVFALGCDGVCIEFDKAQLLKAVDRDKQLIRREVAYREIDEVERAPPATDDLPFVKRWPYEPEGEFRIFVSCVEARPAARSFPIPLSAITHITLSPWMPAALENSVKATLKEIEGCNDIKVHRSGLVDNERWRRAVEPVGKLK